MSDHPLTPPPELVQQWYDASRGPRFEHELATQAARWGADQELEACVDWLEDTLCDDPQEAAKYLRFARRPKPPSLAKQALEAIDEEQADLTLVNYKVIRAALERLQELE